MPWSGSDVIHHIRLSKLSIKSSHWTISTSNAIFHLSSGIFSNGRCNDYGGRPGALLHRAGFGLTQSYAFWFGDCDGQDLSWPIIPTGCACTLKIVRLAAHVYLYCMESLEGLRAEPQWNLSRILNILSTVGIMISMRALWPSTAPGVVLLAWVYFRSGCTESWWKLMLSSLVLSRPLSTCRRCQRRPRLSPSLRLSAR